MNKDGIVKTIVVSLANHALSVVKLVVKVIIGLVRAWQIGADGIIVDILHVFGSQHIVNGLVVHTLVGSQLQTRTPLQVLGDVVVEGAGQTEVQVVIVLGCDEVGCILALLVIGFVGSIEAVEVDLTVGLAACPVVIAALPCICRVIPVLGILDVPYIILAAGEVLPVVGSGVLGIVVL